MCEVNHTDDAVHHRITNGYQRIRATDSQAIQQLLNKVKNLFRHIPLFLSDPRRTGISAEKKVSDMINKKQGCQKRPRSLDYQVLLQDAG